MARVLKNNAFQDGSITQAKIVANSVPGKALVDSPDPRISTITVTNSSWASNGKSWISLTGGYIVLTGTNFRSGCQVLFGSTPAVYTTFVSSTSVRVRAPVKTAGTYFLYLINPDGGTAMRVQAVTYA